MVKFKRVAAAFDEVARGWSSESSGSEHSANLSDLVNSFLEGEITDDGRSEEVDQDIEQQNDSNDDEESNSRDLEIEDSLRNIFDRGDDDAVKRSILAEVEKAWREVGSGNRSSLPDFKRRLMAGLRNRGFDSGLCKSKWEKNGLCPPGEYEYVDINASGTRYIIEFSLAREFTIARATGHYDSLLQIFPQIFIGKPKELKQVVRLMCNAIRQSMKSMKMHVPPWRRLSYMQAKWFGSYKRTINEIPRQKVMSFGGDSKGNRVFGFVPVSGILHPCREDFTAASKAGVRIGNLAAALNQKEMVQ